MALNAQRNWDVSMAENLSSVMTKAKPAKSHAVARGRSQNDAAPTVSLPWRPARPAAHLPAEVLIQVIDYIFDEYCDGEHVTRWTKQHDLHACSLVSRDWNAAATPTLYALPVLQGPNYDPFTRTICPSINATVRKSPLASLVKELDLTMLVHQGSKSVTARLLGRTKNNLERFAAPQASFSLSCFPALGKCKFLTSLDLSLVSEATSLMTLFDTVANLSRLAELHLPRSAGFGAALDPSMIKWPPRLEILGLSGGLDVFFWSGDFHWPAALADVRVTHCPKLDEPALHDFLPRLSAAQASLRRLTFSNLPRLGPEALNIVLALFPALPHLSVSADYVSAELLNPFAVPWHRLPAATVFDDALHAGAALRLESLALTDSGDVGEPDKILPLDLLIMAEDYRTVPLLARVDVVRSLGWFSDAGAEDLESLEDWLVDRARERGGGRCDRRSVGVKMLGGSSR